MQQITFEILECTQYYYVSVRQYYCKEDLPLLQNTIVYSYASDLSLPVFGFFCTMVVMDLIGQNRRRQLKICSNERIAKVMIAFECGYGRNPSIKVWIQVACSYFQIYQTYHLLTQFSSSSKRSKSNNHFGHKFQPCQTQKKGSFDCLFHCNCHHNQPSLTYTALALENHQNHSKLYHKNSPNSLSILTRVVTAFLPSYLPFKNSSVQCRRCTYPFFFLCTFGSFFILPVVNFFLFIE